MVAIALLGSAGLASTWSGPLRRSSAGKHKHLMSHGVPESLMHANITAGYADALCKTFVPSNLTTQHWVDEPMCQRANTTFKVPILLPCACSLLDLAWLALVHQPSCTLMLSSGTNWNFHQQINVVTHSRHDEVALYG